MTEKGYCLTADGTLDLDHAALAANARFCTAVDRTWINLPDRLEP